MLDHPTLDLLHELSLQGMAHGFREIAQNPEAGNLQHGEWLAILLEHEPTWRRQKRFEARARTARLRHAASVEDIDYHAQRGLDRVLVLKLCGCDWVRQTPQSAGDRADRHRQELDRLYAGAQGLPREPLGALSARAPVDGRAGSRRGDGRYAKLLRSLARVNLLILDDWGPEPLGPEQRRDLLEIVEDRYDAGSLLITSQLPIARWYEIIGDPTLADAILDRVIHNAYRIELQGDSLRKRRAAEIAA